MFKDVCNKCGQKIFNGVPEGQDIQDFVVKMKEEGYIIGYNTDLVGSYGNMHEVSIKPICSNCTNAASRKKAEKNTKTAMRKIAPTLKKVFTCPICQEQARNNDNKIFTSTTKSEMMKHIESEHILKDIEYLVPRKEF